MDDNNVIVYNAGDKVAIIIDGNVFRTGIITEFQGDIAIVETPTSILRCHFTYLKHLEDEKAV